MRLRSEDEFLPRASANKQQTAPEGRRAARQCLKRPISRATRCRLTLAFACELCENICKSHFFGGLLLFLNLRLGRALVLAFAAFFIVQMPLPANAQATSATATIKGTVHDETGAPVPDASVILQGAKQYRAATDSAGGFSFDGVTPGVYSIAVTKAGFVTASQSDVAVLAGQSQTLTVQMERVTFSSLRTIASVRVQGSAAINTSAASINSISPQEFVNEGQVQVTRVLSEVPGLQISFPSNSANAASPGSITIPNIRDATSYETASLIDGHPISVGQYGDNVTTFLNSFMFGDIQVIKGPGAESPVVNNAIGGTVNFRTKEPTLNPAAQLLFGFDNRGGSLSNFSYSNTLGKFGFVIDLAGDNNPSALNGKQVYYDPTGGLLGGGTLDGGTGFSNIGNTESQGPSTFGLVACCYTLLGNFDQTAQLYKVRYKFSPSTQITMSYLDSQTTADQNGNTSDFYLGQFAPGPGYAGSLKPGPIAVANIYPGAYNGEHNIEPIFQAEGSTSIGNDTLLARYYNASILRYQFQGLVNAPDFNTVSLFGTSTDVNGGLAATFNGNAALVGFNDMYTEPELDKLQGGSIEYQHPFGNSVLTFSADRTISKSTDYSVFPGPFYSFGLPPGTQQTLSTYLLRDQFNVNSRLNITLSNYLNTYKLTYPIGCVDEVDTGCNTQANAQFGQDVFFQTSNITHDDPRIGIVYRPSYNSSLRFAAGSSIAPPFLGLLVQITSTPVYDKQSGVALESQSNGSLKPETGFGWDLGGDYRFRDNVTMLTGDVYLTNLFNRFFGQTINTGLTCDTVSCQSPGGPIPPGTPVLNQTNANISNARFEGIELALRRAPQVGLGYTLEGALEKGYYYNLPPYFYCSIPGPGCTPDQNLNVISGENTNGIPVGFYNISYNGNMRIPYSQGNAQISYTWRNGAYAMFGDTYFGHNNSLNEPAFGIAYGALRYPVNQHMSLQLSGNNIFNAYSGILPIYGGGVAIPLADGGTGATTGNVLGPATYQLTLMANLP